MGHYTLDFLAQTGPKYAMGYRLPRITARASISYGEVAERLRKDLKIAGKIFSTHIGSVAGPLQNRLQEIEPDVPLLNVLFVRVDSEEAGTGVDQYLKEKFKIRGSIDANRRSALLEQAAQEVYAYKRWATIYRKAFDETPPSADPAEDIRGVERDGKTRGGPAESEEHRQLKAYVRANPALVGATGQLVDRQEEYCLLSGDEVDVFFAKANEFWMVEVKSERSNARDMLRGCYQAIKYRAVFEAQLHRTLPAARVHAVLVTREPLPAAGKAVALDHNIRTVVIPKTILKSAG